jgi:hypothetical protein
MKTLSSALLAAQKSANRQPYVNIEARNNLCGVVNLRWTRLYSGAEMDSLHAMTIPSDGSLVRVRATSAVDSRKLYRQRVASPGTGSDFSQWSYLSQYGVMAVAVCSLGTEVSLFWVKSDTSINYSRSSDCGVTWTTVTSLGSAPTVNVTGLAAAYKPNGDLALFFAHSSHLYVIKRVSGVWQTRIMWDKTTQALTGAAVVYSGDWKLLVSGQAENGDYKVWSLILGDGNEATAGSWSDLKEIASAPYGGSYEYAGVFLDKPDVYRCFFVEKFSGNEAYNRPFCSHTLPQTAFLDNRWREPVPFNYETLYGPAMAHTAAYAWLAAPGGVWRAGLAEASLDLTADILSVKVDLSQDNGRIVIELRNDNGRYASPGQDDMMVLECGCQVDFSPGYVTPEGHEISTGQSFTLQAYEHTSSPGKADLFLYAEGGWEALEKWIARYQFRWNHPDEYGYAFKEAAVKEIISQVLARAGLRLEVITESAEIGGYFPDFTIHAGDNGRAVIKRLLSFIPDVLFLEGNTAYLVNPLAADLSSYSYGTSHVIQEGHYSRDAWKINRVLVGGINPAGPEVITAESFDWDEIHLSGDRLEMLEDLNVSSAALALGRGSACLRQAEIESVSGFIRAPVNCGQQMYDVIDITDSRSGLSAAKRRVLGLVLSYQPEKGQYEQKIKLGAV